MITNKIIAFIFLTVLGVSYFFIAKKFGIVDKPNQRSSHSRITVRGGGILK